MKIIFLDIDGVLNHEAFYRKRRKALADKVWQKSEYPLDEICEQNMLLLNKLIAETGAKVVISSTWRHGRTPESLQSIFKACGFIGDIIDFTPHLTETIFIGKEKKGFARPRGCEIEEWLRLKGFQRVNGSKEKQLDDLEKSQVKNYVILDDDSDILYGQREHFVKCNAYKTGFDEDCLNKAIKILNMDLVELYYKDQGVA